MLISEEYEELAEKEVKEVASRREQDIKLLKDWLAVQPHLKARTGTSTLNNNLIPVTITALF